MKITKFSWVMWKETFLYNRILTEVRQVCENVKPFIIWNNKDMKTFPNFNWLNICSFGRQLTMNDPCVCPLYKGENQIIVEGV